MTNRENSIEIIRACGETGMLAGVSIRVYNLTSPQPKCTSMWLMTAIEFLHLTHTYTHLVNILTLYIALTFDGDLGRGLDHAQGGDGHAGVIGRQADVGELQHVAPHGHLLLLGELHHSAHPLDVGHGGAHCHARQVDAAARHHLVIGGGDGEAGWDATNCRVGRRGEGWI